MTTRTCNGWGSARAILAEADNQHMGRWGTRVVAMAAATAGIDLIALRVATGSTAGAAALYEKLVTDVVATHNLGARRMEGSGGDWGIDTYVGDLDGGNIAVWQAKYFIDGVGSGERRKITESLDTVVARSAKEEFVLKAWTLCLPLELTPAEAKWWARFRKEREAALGIVIELWDEGHLRRLLQAPDCRTVRDHYFPPALPSSPAALPVEDLPDPLMFDDALFVAQLRQAKIDELASAKQQFFNAELLTREVGDKGVPDEVDELRSRRAEVHAVWETRFNKHSAQGAEDVLPGLVPEVMEALEDHHRSYPLKLLRAGPIHTLGLVHQHVQERRAGWTRRWRELANAYRT